MGVVSSPNDEAFISMFLEDHLLPLRRIYSVYNRETVRKWRKDGLPTHKVEGLGICFRPSELKSYIDARA